MVLTRLIIAQGEISCRYEIVAFQKQLHNQISVTAGPVRQPLATPADFYLPVRGLWYTDVPVSRSE